MAKKKYDLFGNVMEHGKITMGTMGVIGITGKLAERMPTSGAGTASNIMGSMDTMKVIPTVHSAGIAMGSLSMLGDVEKQARKKRR